VKVLLIERQGRVLLSDIRFKVPNEGRFKLVKHPPYGWVLKEGQDGEAWTRGGSKVDIS